MCVGESISGFGIFSHCLKEELKKVFSKKKKKVFSGVGIFSHCLTEKHLVLCVCV